MMGQTDRRTDGRPTVTCLLFVPLVPSDSPTLISSLLRLSAHHLALAASASQPPKSGTFSLYLYVPVPVLTPSVVTLRPSTASRPSNPPKSSPLAPQIRLLLTIVRLYKLYLLTYLLRILHRDTHAHTGPPVGRGVRWVRTHPQISKM